MGDAFNKARSVRLSEPARMELVGRLLRHADVSSPNGCWEWIGAMDVHGYGRVTYGGRDMRAHRLSWLAANSELPEGQLVCHTCDNKRCIRPSHFFLGTIRDNTRDAKGKGLLSHGDRHRMAMLAGKQRIYVGRKGNLNNNSKLTAEQVLQIREMVAGGMTHREAGEKFGVNDRNVSQIVNRRTWTHV